VELRKQIDVDFQILNKSACTHLLYCDVSSKDFEYPLDFSL